MTMPCGQKNDKVRAAVVLGSGFSHAAGLPLVRQVFEADHVRFKRPDTKAAEYYEKVREAWRKWKVGNPDKNAEQWLKFLHESSSDMIVGIGFRDATNCLLASLVLLKSTAPMAAYVHGITKSIECVAHQQFWQFVRKQFAVTSVVTLNYDILAERGLRGRYDRRRRTPLFYYGGLPRPQVVKRVRDPRRGKFIPVELTGDIPLFKLHGSLNWDSKGRDLIIHEDVRAACRISSRAGQAAIIAPLPEKEMPRWLTPVWDKARESLAEVETWVVCGYSLPDYDVALRKFFSDAGEKVENLRVFLLDPQSAELAYRWTAILRSSVEVIPLPGIPEALDDSVWPDTGLCRG